MTPSCGQAALFLLLVVFVDARSFPIKFLATGGNVDDPSVGRHQQQQPHGASSVDSSIQRLPLAELSKSVAGDEGIQIDIKVSMTLQRPATDDRSETDAVEEAKPAAAADAAGKRNDAESVMDYEPQYKGVIVRDSKDNANVTGIAVSDQNGWIAIDVDQSNPKQVQDGLFAAALLSDIIQELQ